MSANSLRGYTTVTDFLRQCRPPRVVQFERRFETPAGRQAQVDFAQFKVAFSDEPGVTRIFWLFSMVLGHMPEVIDMLVRAERDGRLPERLRFFNRNTLLIVDEIG